MKFRLFCLVLVFLGAISFITEAAEIKLPQTLAIQSRPYWLKHELSANIAYWPLDHFNTYFSGGVGYAYYLNDYFAWELFNGQWLTNTSTGLQNYLSKSYAAQPEAFDVLNTTMTSSLIYTPFYMKSIYSGQSIVWGDISFVLGGGIANFESNKNISTIDFGIIFRFLLGSKLSAKIDLRGYQFGKEELKPNMILGLGLAYNFGGGPDLSSEELQKQNSQEDW